MNKTKNNQTKSNDINKHHYPVLDLHKAHPTMKPLVQLELSQGMQND